LNGEVIERHLSYWRRQLDRLPTLAMPADRPRQQTPTYRSARLPVAFERPLRDSLKSLSRREGSTLFMTLLATFNMLLSHETRQTDIVVGTDVANRGLPETEKLIGFFVNQLVLRSDLAGDPTFRQALAQVRETALDAYAHQDLPFEKLVEALNPPREPNRTPLFQVKFVLQNAPLPLLVAPGLELSWLESDSGSAKFDLLFNIWETEEGMSGSLEYALDLFDAATIERLIERFKSLLGLIVADPETRLSALHRELSAIRKKQTAPAQRRTSRLTGLKAAKPVVMSELVKSRLFAPGQNLPVVLEPAAPGVELLSWAKSGVSYLNALLQKHGGVLFRGFDIGEASEFEKLIEAIAGAAFAYRERSSPRHAVSGHIYTSTDYPADQEIFPHNENSYAHAWPMKIFFFCAQPAETGGETPIADTRRVLARISPRTREKFARKKVLYVRNYSPQLGLSWRTAFQTDDRAEVEAYCRAAGYQYEWRDGDRLRTRRVGQAVAAHPRTGELIWFNHAAFFHVSTLGDDLRRALLAQFAEEDLPNNTYYGDGSTIELEVLDELRAAYRGELASFQWRRGDVLLLDNMLVAHSRAPFTGPRRILVGMAEPFDGRALAND
jgi:alpha-ketoglutarate-dependent taurine dioxygenase